MNPSDANARSERRFSSLRTQISVGISAFFLVAIALYFTVVYPALREHVIKLEEDKIQLYANATALQIGHDLSSGFREIESIARLPAVRSTELTLLKPTLDLLEEISPLYRGLQVIDSNGVVIAKSSTRDAAVDTILEADKLRAAYQAGQTRIASWVVDQSSNMAVVVTTPVLSDDRTRKVALVAGNMGTVVQSLDTYDSILRPPVPAQWQVSLWSAEGKRLAHSETLRRGGGSVPQPTNDIAVAPVTSGNRVDRSGEKWFSALARIPAAGWTVAVHSPGHLVAREVASATRPITWAFLASLLGLVTLSLLAARRFIRPLETLTEALIRFGREGRTEVVEPGGSWEIAGAIRAFNRVTAERREADEALRASEARFRRIFESNMIGIIFWEQSGNITDANQVFLDLVGYTREDLLTGKLLWNKMTPPEHAHRDEAALKEIAATGVCTPFEKEYICKDGRRVPILLGAAALESDRKRGVCFVVDISGRKQAEETRESLRRLADQMTASLTMEQLGGILARECRALFAYDGFFFDLVDEPIGGHTTVHAEDTPLDAREPVRMQTPARKFSKPVQSLFQGEPVLLNRTEDPIQSDLQPWGVETRRSRSLMFVPIRWEGKCIGVISVQSYTVRKYDRRDLELLQLIADQCGPALARVQSEAALRESRWFVQQIAELMPNVLYVFDFELGRNIFTNREFGPTLGYTGEELDRLGARFVPEVMHPQDQPRFAEHLARMKGLIEGAVVDFEYRMRHKNGQWRWYHSRDTVFARSEDGEVRQFIGTATDITLRKAAEDEIRALNENLEGRVRERTAQLEAANKELEAFSYSVSHDLRAPLRHVSGFANLLRAIPSLAGDPAALHYTTAIVDAARRMGNLIDDLLIFSRMGRTEMRRTRISLADLVRQVRDDLRPELADRIIDWRVGALPEVDGDSAMLRLVFQNLIENAIKYTVPQSHPWIEIGCEEQPAQVTVFVRDNGVGFDMQYADKLFGVFQRLHRDEEFEGTGIGLANVRRIITRHGGRTWAEGKTNEGAVVYFSLPR